MQNWGKSHCMKSNICALKCAIPPRQIAISWSIWLSLLLLPMTMNSVFLLYKVNLLADIQVETFLKSLLRSLISH